MKLVFRTAIFLLMVMPGFARCQEINIRGGFIEDSTKVGSTVRYYLTARYPSQVNLVFPDSGFQYTPFEFEGKHYLPTETNHGKSYDSVVYSLRTFEVDSLLSLSLPIFVLHESDCTIFHSNEDNILLEELVATLPDSLDISRLPLKMNTAYQPVHYSFNYPLVIGIAWVAVLLLSISWILFGKSVRRRWKVQRMHKRHRKFSEEYAIRLLKLRSEFTPLTAESVVTVWKRYLEDLEAAPFTRLTTRETLKILNDTSLENNLREIDREIYGSRGTKVEPFENLRTFADQKFQQRLQEVKNG